VILFITSVGSEGDIRYAWSMTIQARFVYCLPQLLQSFGDSVRSSLSNSNPSLN
jgi:hypothetical protein